MTNNDPHAGLPEAIQKITNLAVQGVKPEIREVEVTDGVPLFIGTPE